MVETNQSEPSKAGDIAQQIVDILIDETSGTRWRAIHAAMILLGEATATAFPVSGPGPEQNVSSEGDLDLAVFFDRDDKLKPSDYALLCAAYHYSLHGTAAFSLEDLRVIASNAGVVLPDRLDMTLKKAAKNGKRLFQPAGRGAYRPTAAAGINFKEQWGVRPGKSAKKPLSLNE
jgi:hypothetical protein